MKHTKRLLSIFLTLCLLLGLLPTTAWAVGQAEITQQPTAGNGYTVVAEYDGSELTEGFQWYKKLDTTTTYTLVGKDKVPGENELAADWVDVGTYADGCWTAEDWSPDFVVHFTYKASLGDRVTVRIPTDQVSDALTVKDDDGNPFQKTGDGIYTATFDEGGENGNGISIKNGRTFTAVITVERFNWEPLSEETIPSLQTRKPGSYYCVVSHESGVLMSDTVTFLSPEDQATADWLAGLNMLTLGCVTVTATMPRISLATARPPSRW